ncbi:MAG: phytanoyl-CoA dioxygenase family protein [Candidatus Poribacteria bacterium]|nr:phytanoyl-CoA dioxygenase family protein [Candidatus Poribacteria bacterium]
MPNDPHADFLRDGYFIQRDPIIPFEIAGAASEGMDALRRGEYDTGTPPQPSFWNVGDPMTKLCKIEMPQIANRAIMSLVSHPALGELAARVLNATMVQVWWVQLLIKPPKVDDAEQKNRIGWHQDRNYWGSWEADSELFTAWVAVSDVREESGPMKFVRGSNRWGVLDGSDFYGQDLEGQQKGLAIPDGKSWEEASATFPAGGVSFHDRLTLHGSLDNLSGEERRSFAIHMRTENSRPVNDERRGLTQFIDNEDFCPVIFGSL